VRLPDIVVIGGMKCGTSALHAYLDAHPEVAMSRPKELNFFRVPAGNGDVEDYADGMWHRGVDWYAAHFPEDPEDAPVCGEASPGYTSPVDDGVAARMASVVPGVRLIMLVRDPIDRALSQYAHHVADGDERRPVAEALLDPGSQYIARGCYRDRLAPFLAHFRREQLALVCSEDLDDRREATLREVFAFVGADPGFRSPAFAERRHAARVAPPPLPEGVRSALAAAFAEDAAWVRATMGRELPWSV
jgi:hypothetical protein